MPDWTSVFARPQTQLAGSPASYPVGDTTQTFTLASDTSVVSVLIPNFFNVTNLQIKGHTSGFTYFKAEPIKTSFAPYYVAVIDSAVDTAIDVEVNTGVLTTVYISSIPDPVAAIALPSQPAPWQAPNQPLVEVFFMNPGPGVDVTVIPAPVNAQSIWLHTMAYITSAVNANLSFRWQTSDGTRLFDDTFSADASMRNVDLKGVKLKGGLALNFHQVGTLVANTLNIMGTIAYSIY